ncbi:MAG: AAA family ATPase [Candidatus Tectimicrobiota bacterium]
MAIETVLPQVVDLLQRQGWASYRTLRRRFHLDAPALTTLTEILVAAHPVVVSEDGTRLLWTVPVQVAMPPGPGPGLVLPVPPVVGDVAQRHQTSSSTLTHLVGREPELAVLQARWSQVHAGQGQIVLLRGEAGIGKSRLVQALKDASPSTAYTLWECRCDPAAQYSAWYPIVALLQRTLRTTPGGGPAPTLSALEALCVPYGLTPSEVVPPLARLLSLAYEARYPAVALSAERQKQQLLSTVATVLQAVAAQQPLLFIVEDVHWLDSSTLECLRDLSGRLSAWRCLLLLTARPEFAGLGPLPGHATVLTLQRLLPAQSAVLAQTLSGAQPLPESVLQQIVARTEGVPLFVEEMTRMLLTTDLAQTWPAGHPRRGPLPAISLPGSVQESVHQRLQALGDTAVTTAHVLAAWGRAATETQLQATVPLGRQALAQALAHLVNADIVREIDLPPRLTYVFKHALMQEATYASIPDAQRQVYHQRIAEVIASQFPGLVQTRPEVLAHHYTAAGALEQAVTYWWQAGQRALERSAHVEAIAHLHTSLALLARLPHTPEQRRQELAIIMALGPALMAIKGNGAGDVEQLYTRARLLCQQIGTTPQHFAVLEGLWRWSVNRAALPTALTFGEELFHLAQQTGEPERILAARQALGQTHYYRGAFATARTYLEMVETPPTAAQTASTTSGTHASLAVYCSSFLAQTLWLLGYPDQAVAHGRTACALAQGLGHPLSQTIALYYAGRVHLCRRDVTATQELAQAALALATEHEFALWIPTSQFLLGWALATQGQWDEGLRHMRTGIEATQQTGTLLPLPLYDAVLADIAVQAGQTTLGLQLVTEGLATVVRTGLEFYAAELYRVQGELLLQQDSAAVADAEASFQRALAVARWQQARALELRAALSLGRLWQSQGQQAAARDILAGVVGWFTEGCDTPDFQEAHALLARLR